MALACMFLHTRPPPFWDKSHTAHIQTELVTLILVCFTMKCIILQINKNTEETDRFVIRKEIPG